MMNQLLLTAGLLMSTTGIAETGWDFGSFMLNAISRIQTWGGYVIILIGIIMILVSVYQFATGFISHGKKQTNWGVAIALLILGGAFAAGGWTFVASVAGGGKKTIEDLGTVILPYMMWFR